MPFNNHNELVKKELSTVSNAQKNDAYLPHVWRLESDHCIMAAADKDLDDDSVTSQDEALMEMLGLASPFLVGQLNEGVNDDVLVVHSAGERTKVSPDSFKVLSTPSFQRIALPRNVSRHFHDPEDCFALVIPDLLSSDECQQLIALGTNGGFDYIRHAMHTAADGSHYQVELQNPNRHKLSVFRHPGWVDLMWKRIRPVLQLKRHSDDHNASETMSLLASFLERESSIPPPTGLNPRLRVLQYDADNQDEFAPHFDATTRIGDQISLLTVLLYLNSGGGQNFDGGETYFLNAALSTTTTSSGRLETSDYTKVTPRAGTAVIFEHDLFHSGHPLEWGTKHVLRTDLLFEISETEWEQRPVKAALSKERPQDTNGSSDDADGIAESSPPTTIQGLVAWMARNEEWSPTRQEDVAQGLDTLGMLDSSIESFCAPGRFALQLMIQDVLKDNRLPAVTTSNRTQESGTSGYPELVRRLIDEAFKCLQQTR